MRPGLSRSAYTPQVPPPHRRLWPSRGQAELGLHPATRDDRRRLLSTQVQPAHGRHLVAGACPPARLRHPEPVWLPTIHVHNPCKRSVLTLRAKPCVCVQACLNLSHAMPVFCLEGPPTHFVGRPYDSLCIGACRSGAPRCAELPVRPPPLSSAQWAEVKAMTRSMFHWTPAVSKNSSTWPLMTFTPSISSSWSDAGERMLNY